MQVRRGSFWKYKRVFGIMSIWGVKTRSTVGGIGQLTQIVLLQFLFVLNPVLALPIKLLPHWNVLFVVFGILSPWKLVVRCSSYFRLERKLICTEFTFFYPLLNLNCFFKSNFERLPDFLNTPWVYFRPEHLLLLGFLLHFQIQFGLLIHILIIFSIKQLMRFEGVIVPVRRLCIVEKLVKMLTFRPISLPIMNDNLASTYN